MKRLLLLLVLLSVILSGIALAQVTITVFGGSKTENLPANYLLGDTQPTQKTYTFTDPSSFSTINVTYQTIGQCYNYMVDNDGDGTPETTVYECGTPQLCITLQGATQQCKPLVMQGTFPKSGQQRLSYTLSQPTTSGTIDFTYNTYQSRGMPQIKIIKLDWDGGISGSVVKPINFFRNKTGPITLGPISGIVSLQAYAGKLKVTSNDTKVTAYFAPDQSYTPEDGETEINYNPAAQEQVLACLSTYPQTSYTCDYQHEERCAQRNPPSDWYNGVCCGDANVNPNAESPPTDCKYYGTVAGLGNRVMNAICGKSGTSWAWAGQLDPGVITNFTTCGAMTQVVATGTQFITCGNTQNTAGITVNQLQGTTDIAGHTYWCEGQQLRECGGANPYSPSQYIKTTGARVDINNEAYYCGSTGTLRKYLDGDEQGCLAAGFAWTGSKCCGEPDDPLKTYTDPNGTGVCVNNQVLSQGSVTGIEQDILIHNGAYYFCNEQKALGYTGTTTIADFPGVQINERGSCGLPLLNVKATGLDKNAVCTPQGTWQFVEFTQTSGIEQTGWTPTSTQTQTGCCPTNMCWDGNQCRASGHFVSIGGRGYRCP